MSRAEALAHEIAANAPLALGEVLRVVDGGLDQPLDKAVGLEAEAFGRLAATADRTEGTQAFVEKRAPVWKNE
jgi:enoyl-CoA hydratase